MSERIGYVLLTVLVGISIICGIVIIQAVSAATAHNERETAFQECMAEAQRIWIESDATTLSDSLKETYVTVCTDYAYGTDSQ